MNDEKTAYERHYGQPYNAPAKPQACGCRAVDWGNDLKIVYCPRHDPANVDRLEMEVEKLTRQRDDWKAAYEGLVERQANVDRLVTLIREPLEGANLPDSWIRKGWKADVRAALEAFNGK